MMKKIFFLAASAALLLAATCRDDEGSLIESIEMNFKSSFGNAPLVMYESAYPYEAGMAVKLQLFQFYLSNISLQREDNSFVLLKDVALISFKDILTPAAAAEGITLNTEGLAAGHYKGIRMGIGVAPNLNSTNPANYTPPHPLDDNYWSAATGYVFIKIEGNADTTGNGQFPAKLTFHTGANDIYKEKTFQKHIELKEGEPLQLNFSMDLKKVLSKGPDNFLDFRQITQDHSNNPAVYTFIADNLFDALVLE
ncbi:MAG: MbnP family protein [Saprospiraceae bacterium]|nr:MbnP family protein [Saprospiraceae bacterium]